MRTMYMWMMELELQLMHFWTRPISLFLSLKTDWRFSTITISYLVSSICFIVRPSASAGIPSTGVWATRSDVSSDEISDYLQNHPYQSDFIAGTSAFKASTPRSVYEGSLASDRFGLLPVPMGMVSIAAPPSTCHMSFRSYPATSFVGSIYLLG